MPSCYTDFTNREVTFLATLFLCLSAAPCGRAVAQAVSCRPLLNAEARVGDQVTPCGFGGRKSGTGTDFSSSRFVFSCQYHSTAAPYLLTNRLEDGQKAH
jgi:hypothetical protein